MAQHPKKTRVITPFQILVSYYFIAIATSFLFIKNSGVYKDGVDISLIDTLFTAVSAVSVTGLTVFELSEALTSFGMIVLLVILQLGAIGIMSLGTLFGLLWGKESECVKDS